MTRGLLVALVSTLALLAGAASAHAATVTIDDAHHYLVVKGGPVPENLTVAPGSTAGSLQVRSQGSGPLGPPPPGCAPQGPEAITCGGALQGVYLDGDGGDDHLTLTAATPQPSVIVGGDGNDTILARDGATDYVYCGSGLDRAEIDAGDKPSLDCETVEAAPTPKPAPKPPAPPAPPVATPPQPPAAAPAPAPVRIAAKPVTMTRAGVLPLVLRCPATETRDCKGTLTLRLRGSARTSSAKQGSTILGKARFRAHPGGKVRVRVKLSRHGRRRIIRRKRARCSVVARTGSHTRTQTITVRAR